MDLRGDFSVANATLAAAATISFVVIPTHACRAEEEVRVAVGGNSLRWINGFLPESTPACLSALHSAND